MTTASIPCEMYRRLAHAANPFYNAKPNRPCLDCIRIDGDVAVATNSRIMVVERLPVRADGMVSVSLDPAIIDIAEHKPGGVLTVTTIPGVEWATIADDTGWTFQGNGLHPGGDEYPDWRKIIPGEPVEPYGFMLMNGELIGDMGRASPSGYLVFPEVIDTRRPVIVRDRDEDGWMGMFLPTSQERTDLKAAVRPDWV